LSGYCLPEVAVLQISDVLQTPITEHLLKDSSC